jgi:hypothetical protein
VVAEQIVAATNALKPDLVLLLGDYPSGSAFVTRTVPLPGVVLHHRDAGGFEGAAGRDRAAAAAQGLLVLPPPRRPDAVLSGRNLEGPPGCAGNARDDHRRRAGDPEWRPPSTTWP